MVFKRTQFSSNKQYFITILSKNNLKNKSFRGKIIRYIIIVININISIFDMTFSERSSVLSNNNDQLFKTHTQTTRVFRSSVNLQIYYKCFLFIINEYVNILQKNFFQKLLTLNLSNNFISTFLYFTLKTFYLFLGFSSSRSLPFSHYLGKDGEFYINLLSIKY